jgi:hypothetical protein
MFEFNHAGDAQADQQHCHNQADRKYQRGSEAEFHHLASKVTTHVDARTYINSKIHRADHCARVEQRRERDSIPAPRDVERLNTIEARTARFLATFGDFLKQVISHPYH